MATAAELEKAVEAYPSLRGFISNPEVSSLLVQAANEGWPPSKLQSKLQDTVYWKNSTEQSRAWDLLRATDPHTADAKWKVGWEHLADLRKKLGIQITQDQFRYIATTAIANGWSDDTISSTFLGFSKEKGPIPAGDLGAAITQTKAMANEYGVTVSDHAAYKQAKNLLLGAADAAGLAEHYKAAALSQYGSNKNLVDALNRGVTVRQYADPYLQLAQQELGVTPSAQNLADPKWNAFLHDIDPKTGTGLCLDQWRAKIRQDSTYGYNTTSGAADQASQLVSGLAKAFGATG